MTTEAASGMTVVVNQSGVFKVEVIERARPLTVEIASRGPQGVHGVQGIQGIQGPGVESIGGYPVAVEGSAVGDLIVFNGIHWSNENKKNISDGGNF